MASTTAAVKSDQNTPDPGRGEPPRSPRQAAAAGGGFLSPYKPGQGFWTRLGTGIGAGLVILFTVIFLYRELPVWTELTRNEWPLYIILSSVALVLSVLAWWLINRPRHGEFLINVDAEMKKVNWATRRELIGSTKVVIVFMLFLATVLFGYDIVFGAIFYMLNVLKFPPLGIGG